LCPEFLSDSAIFLREILFFAMIPAIMISMNNKRPASFTSTDS